MFSVHQAQEAPMSGGYGIYEQHEFPPYKFQEYPKMVRLVDGTVTTVHSKSEELMRMQDIAGAVPVDDPLLKERNQLAEEVAKLREQLAARVASQEAQAQPKPSGTTTLPEAMKQSTSPVTAITK